MMISDLRGPIPGIEARCTLLIFASLSASLFTSSSVASVGFSRTNRFGIVFRACILVDIAKLASASAAAVPEVAITRLTRGCPSLRSARFSSLSTNCFSRVISSFDGGSAWTNSCCSRTAPSGRLTISFKRH